MGNNSTKSDVIRPLSPQIANDLGWGTPGQLPKLILTIRTPLGYRCIPTRELLPDGSYCYGFIDIHESDLFAPEPLEPWEISNPDESLPTSLMM